MMITWSRELSCSCDKRQRYTSGDTLREGGREGGRECFDIETYFGKTTIPSESLE